MSHRHSNSLLCLLGMVILFATGCSSRNLLDSTLLGDSFSSSMQSFQQRLFQKKKNKIAVRCFTRLEAAQGPNLKGHPGRGSQCWFNFFAPGIAESIKVDGDVRIYVFDDRGMLEEQKRPIHQFDFSAKTWNAYLYKQDLGPTYGVWIPYTKPGNQQVKMTLMLRMTPKVGPVVYSELTTLPLPGTKPKSKKQFAGLNAKEFNLNRSNSVQTMVHNYRRQTGRKIENPLVKENTQNPSTRKVTSELATKKLFQLLNEQMKNSEFAKIEKRQTIKTSVDEKNPLEIFPDTESIALPDRVRMTVPSVTPRKRFRLSPAPGTTTAKTSKIEPVRTILQGELKTDSPAPPPPLSLPAQSNQWHSLDN